VVKKVSVSLSEELLDKIDAEAEALGVTRSGIVQEASAHYLAHTRDERDVEQRRRDAAEIVAGFGSIAALPARDTRPSLQILREVRALDGVAPAASGRPAADGRAQ